MSMPPLSVPLTDAIYDRLAASADVLANVDDYAGGPAIIAQAPVPPGVEGCYVAMNPPLGVVPFDTKDRDGRTITMDIGIYGPRDSYNRVDRLADATLAALHRCVLLPSGWSALVVSCQGPIGAPTDDTMTGRIVTLTARLRSGTVR